MLCCHVLVHSYFPEAKVDKDTAAIISGPAMMGGFNPMMPGPAGDMGFVPYMYPGLPGMYPGMPAVPFMQPGIFPSEC